VRKVLQLFNGRPAKDPGPPGARPDHTVHNERILSSCGWETETLPTHPFPWNPFARMHNAYVGLDPLRTLRVLLGRRDADCVCGHLESVVGVLLLRRLFGFRPKVIVWEVPWSPGWAYRDTLSRLALPRADMNVVFDSSQLALVRGVAGDRAPVAVVPFCIDVDFFRPTAPAAGRDGYVYSVGRDNGRDFDIVVEAMAGTPFELVLRTSTPVDVPADCASRVVQVAETVPWARYRSLYEGAAIVVVAARETANASGVTSLLEAMAMGLPVVVTGTRALSDYLPPEDAGVVLPVGDAEAIRRAVTSLMSDPERRMRMGRRAREVVIDRFSPSAHFQALARMLDAAVDGTPTGSS